MEAAPPISPAPSVRLDKWLWAVRLFKTRSLATQACRGGHISVAGAVAKPSRDIRPGEIITVRLAELTRTVKVRDLLEKRVGPKLVPDYLEDLTPAAEYLKVLRRKEDPAAPKRPKGAGRPTKKERRSIEKFESGGLA